jgi:endonuclease/exonuclease/phosphatase family metal-dependent hydrolase
MATHLEYYSALQRRAQIECLRQLNAEACEQSRRGRAGRPGDGPFDAVARAAPGVIVGDFNCEPSAPEIAALQDSVEFGIPRLCDAWTLVHPGRAHEPTLGVFDKQQWPGPAKTYDFAFVTEDLAARVRRLEIDSSSDASDHQALVIELR